MDDHWSSVMGNDDVKYSLKKNQFCRLIPKENENHNADRIRRTADVISRRSVRALAVSSLLCGIGMVLSLLFNDGDYRGYDPHPSFRNFCRSKNYENPPSPGRRFLRYEPSA